MPPSPSSKGLKELKLWLRGLVNRPDLFISHPPHTLTDLQDALYLAIAEINEHLDPALEYVVDRAKGEENNIQLKAGDFIMDQRLNVYELHEQGMRGIQRLSRKQLVKRLVLARDEIEWLNEETRRLEVHCQIAGELIKQKLRTSFEYHPRPRERRTSEYWDIGDTYEWDVEEEDVEMEDDDVNMADDEGEEILEDDRNGRRDSVAGQSWGTLKLEAPS